MWLACKNQLIIFFILILAAGLRFYHLGQTPSGMAWDEAAIGYNGYAVWTTRRDEWLERLPISFRSFGDYKAPLAIYQSGLTTALWGQSLWAVRLPFALHGVLAVLAIYLLVLELMKRDPQRRLWANLAALLLATSPWHIHYSRLAFESAMALNLLLWAVWAFWRYLHQRQIWYLLLSAGLAVSTLYTYHSSKVTVPLLFLAMMGLYSWRLWRRKKQLLLAASLGLLLLVPLIYDSFWQNGLERASSTVFAQSQSLPELAGKLLHNALSYVSLDFLIFGQNMGNFRHGDGQHGVIEPLSLVLMFVYLLWRKKEKRLWLLAVLWLGLGLLPAIVAEGPASSNRSILALPGFILWIVLAVAAIWRSLNGQRHLFYGVLCVYYLTMVSLYQYDYHRYFEARSRDDFMVGYLETFAYLRQLDRSQIRQIVFTSDYQHPYIYALFSFAVNPIAYQGGILNSFFFTDKIDNSDLERPEVIVVASKFDQLDARPPDQVIRDRSGEGRFFIYLPREQLSQ